MNPFFVPADFVVRIFRVMFQTLVFEDIEMYQCIIFSSEFYGVLFFWVRWVCTEMEGRSEVDVICVAVDIGDCVVFDEEGLFKGVEFAT